MLIDYFMIKSIIIFTFLLILFTIFLEFFSFWLGLVNLDVLR